jgi:poly(beta-D-mannuronate) lyase
LTNWYLTLPVDTALPDNPDVVMQPQLAAFALSPYFRVTDAKDGIVFQAHAGGATTDNSSYPRSELREMTNGGKTKASWSNTQGTHTLTIRQAITHVPTVKPEVVAGQIHDKSDDVVMIRLEGSRLFVESDGENIGDLNTQYQLGTAFTVRIEASGGHIRVLYDGTLKVDYTKSGSGFYFKAGCYTQSNVSKGDNPQAYGEVIIYSLQVSHT